MTVRVLLADDEELVRTGLRMILGAEPGLEVVGEAANGAEAIRLVDEVAPDVVLMDLRMPVLDGLEATRRLHSTAVAIVILTTFDTDTNVHEALAAGAAGFLLKDAPAERLVAAVRAAAAGDAVLAGSVAKRVVGQLVRRTANPAEPQQLDALTDREREVLSLMADGCSNAEIAAALHRRGHRQDSRRPDPDEAGCARPAPGRGGRLPLRPCGLSARAGPGSCTMQYGSISCTSGPIASA